MVQGAVVLLMTGVLKTYSPDWTQSGDALYYAAHSRHTAIGSALLAVPPGALRLASRGSLVVEIGVPLLLFSPIGTRRARALLAPLAMGFLVAIWLCLDVGILPLLEAVALLPFVPGEVFERIASRWARAPGTFAGVRPLTAPVRLPLGRLGTLACAVLLFDIVGYNLDSLPNHPLPSVVVLRPLAQRLGVNQWWPMFTAPSHTLDWVVVAGVSAAGEEMLSPLADGLPAAEDPRARAHSLYGYRWLKLFEGLLEEPNPARWQRIALVLCDAWTRSGAAARGERAVVLYAATQDVLPQYRYGGIQVRPLARERCAAGPR